MRHGLTTLGLLFGLALATHGQQPCLFVENAGQWHESVRYATWSRGALVRVLDDALLITDPGDEAARRPGTTVRLGLPGATRVVVTRPSDTPVHLLKGHRNRWRRGLDSAEHVELRGSSGVLALEASARGVRVRVRPTGSSMDLEVEGVEGIREDGSFVSAAGGDLLRWSGAVRRAGANRLTVDDEAEVLWGGVLGGSGWESVRGAAADSLGRAFVTGRTQSADLPVTPGAFDTTLAEQDIFVLAIAQDGSSIDYLTFLGGEFDELPYELDIVGGTSAVVLGSGGSPDYPVTDLAPFPSPLGNFDILVSVLTPDGSGLEFSTFLGGEDGETPIDLACDGGARLAISAFSHSDDYPVTAGVYLEDPWPGFPGPVLTILDTATGIIEASSFVKTTCAPDFAPDGSLVLFGGGTPVMETTPGALATSGKLYVWRMPPDLSGISDATYVLEQGGGLSGGDLAVGPTGLVHICGETSAQDFFTTPGAFKPTTNALLDGVVLCFDLDAMEYVYSTYLGADGITKIHSIHVDQGGVATLFGDVVGNGFPVTPGAESSAPDTDNAFVSRLDPTGSRLLFSTDLGGSEDDGSLAEGALRADGTAILAGATQSADFPVSGTFGTGLVGLPDFFVAALETLPDGVSRVGEPAGLLAGASRNPLLGVTDFGLFASGFAPFGAGWLVLGLDALSTPRSALGAPLWVDLAEQFALIPITAGFTGFAEGSGRLPADPAAIGVVVYAQFFAPFPGEGAWRSSQALRVELLEP